jgi:hypothetical protein
LDMDSSVVSPTPGEQEMSVSKGRYAEHVAGTQDASFEIAELVEHEQRIIAGAAAMGGRAEAGVGALSRQGLAHLFSHRRGLRQS